jgi:hypothetical protein
MSLDIVRRTEKLMRTLRLSEPRAIVRIDRLVTMAALAVAVTACRRSL